MKNSDLLVFGHSESGHAYKVCLYLELLERQYRYKSVDIFKPLAERDPAFVKLSKYGEVPVMVHGDVVLTQSNAILLYLDEVFGSLASKTAHERSQINEWLFWEMSRLAVGVANLRSGFRFTPDMPQPVIEEFRARSVQALKILDSALQKRAFLVGDAITIADISCCGYLFWLDQAQLDIAKFPQIERWLQTIADQPGWKHPSDLI